MVGSCIGFSQYFSLFFDSVLRLLGAINPLAVAALFLAAFSSYGFRQRMAMARLASVTSFFLLLSFVLCGKQILNTLGIGVPSIYVACGLIYSVVGFKFLTKKDSDDDGSEPLAGPVTFSRERPNMSIIPLTVPMIFGARQIAAAIECSQASAGLFGKLAVSLSAAVAVVITFTAIYIASFLTTFLSSTLGKLFFRVGGLVILAIGFQQVLVGLEGMEPFCNMVRL